MLFSFISVTVCILCLTHFILHVSNLCNTYLYIQLQQKKIEEAAQQPATLELPKLRKVEKKEEVVEKKEETTEQKKKVVKKVVKKKVYDDLPEIPDYERPALEKYEKVLDDPVSAGRQRTSLTPLAKPEQASVDKLKAEQESVPYKNGLGKKDVDEPDQNTRKLSMGKGELKNNNLTAESVKLKPFGKPEVLFLFFLF